ncbi:hypothetical protein [Phaeobacter inhibens]|uniref:hypothetical protein n=1 Tax=Phaeobacter inhibens TaxID=221822 RepID=UPI0021A93FC1|nr:hypothetical protein [Phaeobacter inhibens]UWS06756.1 hypothetical protein K4K98_10845 [Phaeobacter inhibens]
MKSYFAGLSVAGAALSALPAYANGPPITQFNGYSVTIEAGKAAGLDPINAVKAKAEDTCASVGKSARLEDKRQIRPLRFQYFFVCI